MTRSLLSRRKLVTGRLKTTRGVESKALVPPSKEKSQYRKIREDVDKKFSRKRKWNIEVWTSTDITVETAMNIIKQAFQKEMNVLYVKEEM